MASKNDITGDSISSKVLSQQGRDNWDVVFQKKTPNEWLKESEGWVQAHYFESSENPISRSKWIEDYADSSYYSEKFASSSFISSRRELTSVIVDAGLYYKKIDPTCCKPFGESNSLSLCNASVFAENIGVVWRGDLLFETDLPILQKIVNMKNTSFYILQEIDENHFPLYQFAAIKLEPKHD